MMRSVPNQPLKLNLSKRKLEILILSAILGQ